jgi:hypothetical protein
MPSEPINPSRVQAIAHDVLSDDLHDFASSGRGVYVRPIDGDVAHVLKLQAWKGASYSFNWGVSLAYVPTKLALPLRFHRTVKSAKLDLWEDHFTDTQDFPSQAYATAFAGESAARSSLDQAWRWARPRARAWWEAATTLEGVLELAELQATKDMAGKAHHVPAPQVVQLLTLARLHRTSDVERHLESSEAPLDPAEREALLAAIDRISAS